VSFTFFLFVVVYCIPLVILAGANTVTLRGLKQMREKIENGIQTTMNRKRLEMERRIVKSKIGPEERQKNMYRRSLGNLVESDGE
jgi:hypothetical protein